MNQAPDFIEPVRAWRLWHAVERSDELHLQSLFYRIRWPALEPLEAECRAWRPPWRRHRSHTAPSEACRCGIYAADLETVIQYLPPYPPRTECPILGRVFLWGSVVECREGWRASHAYPESLYVPSTATRGREHAARVAARLERYGVAVELLDLWCPRGVAWALSDLGIAA